MTQTTPRAPWYRRLSACLRGVMKRQQRAQARRAVAMGSPWQGIEMLGINISRIILAAIRAYPQYEGRFELYGHLVRNMVLPGGRLRRIS